jgi:hypothetical protein
VSLVIKCVIGDRLLLNFNKVRGWGVGEVKKWLLGLQQTALLSADSKKQGTQSFVILADHLQNITNLRFPFRDSAATSTRYKSAQSRTQKRIHLRFHAKNGSSGNGGYNRNMRRRNWRNAKTIRKIPQKPLEFKWFLLSFEGQYRVSMAKKYHSPGQQNTWVLT